MRPADDIKRFSDRAAVSTNPRMDKTVLDTVLMAHEETMNRDSTVTRPRMRSIVMRSPITRIAAAAVVIVVVVLFIGLWDRSVPSAYALDQTIEANRTIRYLHIRNFTAGHEEPREGWIEFGEDGQAEKVRAHMPEWASPVDGPRVIVWKDGTVQMWLKRQNRLAITKADDIIQEQLDAILQELDPRLALAHVSDLEKQGKVKITVAEPSDRTEPILVTATYLPESESPDRRKILSVDPTTKLINVIELYRLKDGEYQREGRIELQEYNEPIDASMFDLTDKVPADATRLDFAATDLGLAQGQLSDEEVATAVVRKFFEALVAGDYDMAGRLLPMGAARLKEQFGGVKFLRIVSIGPTTRNRGAETREVTVPCTIEIEEDGKKSPVTLNGVEVQPLAAQPSRWTIKSLGN